MFLKKGDVMEARRRIRRYQEFKELSFELVQASVEQARLTGLKKERQ